MISHIDPFSPNNRLKLTAHLGNVVSARSLA